jgi:hypothetical protein
MLESALGVHYQHMPLSDVGRRPMSSRFGLGPMGYTTVSAPDALSG